MAKKAKKSKQKANEYKTIAQSLKDRGKLTLGKHFEEAAELIESQEKEIGELKNVKSN